MARTLNPKNETGERRSLRFLGLLLSADIAFVMLHASHVRFDVPGSGLWLISRDRGFPEVFQYLKEAAIVVLLVLLFRQRRSPVYSAWALAFTYLLIDDSLEIHETAGERLATAMGLGSIFGIEARDLGQVLVSAIAGAILVTLIAIATLRDHSDAQLLSIRLAPVVLALAFFGIITDVIDAIDLFGVVEDGGEMVAMSAAVAVVIDHRLKALT